MPYIVYKHTCIKNGKVYIGITSHTMEQRAGLTGRGYKAHNPHFWAAIQKYGWKDGFTHEVLFTFDTIEEAEQKEIELIALYDATNREHGYNVLIGGNCTQHPSEETRRKIAEKSRGRKVSEETKEKIRLANIGRVVSDESRKRMSDAAKKRERNPLSDETKKKIGDANRGRKYSEEYCQIMSDRAEKIPVKQFDEQGNFIAEYESITAAGKALNISKSHISDCCKGDKLYKTAGGYQWRFADDNTPVEVVTRQKAPKPIIQKDLDGNVLAWYPSAFEANKVTGIDASSISKCARGKLKYFRGYIWEYAESPN